VEPGRLDRCVELEGLVPEQDLIDDPALVSITARFKEVLTQSRTGPRVGRPDHRIPGSVRTAYRLTCEMWAQTHPGVVLATASFLRFAMGGRTLDYVPAGERGFRQWEQWRMGMDLGIDGRRAVVIGATSGLGRSIAERLSAEGANVVVAGRRTELAAELASSLAKGRSVAIDLTSAASIEAAIGEIRGSGDPDILVLNGGGPRPIRALEATAADVREASMLILESMLTLTRAFLPGMLTQGWGRIVAVGSSGISAPIPGLVLSNSLRNALWGYLKTLSAEVASAGVTVNMVSPGRIDTDRVRSMDEHRSTSTGHSIEETQALALSAIPIGRYGRVEELAAVAAFLCSSHASYMTGSNMRVDGGMVNCL